MNTDPNAPVVVTIPPSADHLHLLRVITGSVASGVRLPLDSIEDLRLAVDEAASYLIALAPEAPAVALELIVTDRDLRAMVSTRAVVPMWPPAGFEDSLPWKIISGLCDETMVKLVGDSPAIEMRKRTIGA